MSRLKTAAAALAAILWCGQALAAGQYMAFEPSEGSNLSMSPGAINAKGDVAATAFDGVNTTFSFIRRKSGGITRIDQPWRLLEVHGINASRATTGLASEDVGGLEGFVGDAKGHITTFRVDGSGANGIGTQGEAINDDGTVTGIWSTAGSYVAQGFVRDGDGTLHLFTAPGAGIRNTLPLALNQDGYAAGYFEDGDSAQHGFVRAPDGTFKAIDIPNAVFTRIFCINKKRTTAGIYTDEQSERGFVRSARGKVTFFDVPGDMLQVNGINDKGAVVGSYRGTDQKFHGYVRAADGTLTTLDEPDSINDTYAVAINNAGIVSGTYTGADFTFHGYIWKP